MINFIFWGVSILASIIICWQTENKRWLKSFLTSTVIIFIGKLIIIKIDSSETNNELTTDLILAILGQSFGFGIITGSVGYFIGNAIFK